MSRAFHRIFGLVATGAVVGAVVWGFAIAGSPESRRLRRIDERRIQALMEIQSEIQELVRPDGRSPVLRTALPEGLEALRKARNDPRLEISDPESGEPFGYRILSKTTYELTATFAFEREARWRAFWNHEPGERTFRVDVMDPPR